MHELVGVPWRYASEELLTNDAPRGGTVLYRPQTREAIDRAVSGRMPVLVDPAAYDHSTADAEKPFSLPKHRRITPTLDGLLDEQLDLGLSAALTPTKLLDGSDDALKAAITQAHALSRNDFLLTLPVDIIHLEGSRYLLLKAEVVASELPIALVIRGVRGPKDLSRAARSNLRDLVMSAPVMPMRVGLLGLDLLAHGAFAAAIGIPSPSRPVLFPELLTFYPGSAIAELYGNRRSPKCHCQVCEGRRISRFTARASRLEAMAHSDASLSARVRGLLAASDSSRRVEYGRGLFSWAVCQHKVIGKRLDLLNGLRPRDTLLFGADRTELQPSDTWA